MHTSFFDRSICVYAGAYVWYVRIYAKLFPSHCSEESLIASISRPESTVSKLFVPRGSSGRFYGKEGRLNSVGGSVQIPRNNFPGLFPRRRKTEKCPDVNCTFVSKSRLVDIGISFRDRVARRCVERLDGLIYAALIYPSRGSKRGWSRWRFGMQSNYSTGTTCRENGGGEPKKKVQKSLTSGKKTDCENLRIPLSARSDAKGGEPSIFKRDL